MKIYGPYKSSDKRSRIFIKYEDGTTITKSYPRYIMENYLGVELDPNEDVHHIDENVENNDISNLEIVWHKDHCREHSIKYKEPLQVNCFYCNTEFTLTTKQQSNRFREDKRGHAGPFCSRRCSGKYGADIQRAAK